jgi:flagellar hook-associated protein 1 FlgK
MSGITFVLNLAREALMAQQRGIHVTGHNIANVNTPGYTRQRLILTANAVTVDSRIKLGLGVKSDSVVQYFDRLTTKHINQRTSELSKYESKQSILEYLQGIFNEESGNGLNKTLEDFWNAWQDLADNPGGIAERTALLQKTNNMCHRFYALYNGLVQTKDEMNTNLKISVNELNTLTEQVASLNERIVASEASGTTANDLRDQRINAIEKMSQLVDTTYIESDNGSMMVLTTSGIPLVDGNESWELNQEGNNIYWNNIPTDISNRLSGGKIGAWMDLRDEIIPQYMADLDELAGTMISQVNGLHYGGYALDNSTNRYFFNPFNMGPLQYGAPWTGSSTVSVGGAYTGNATKTFTFTIDGSGTVGTNSFDVDWIDGQGNSGNLLVTPTSYSNLSVFEGIQISFGAGDVVVDTETFSVAVTDNTGAAGSIALSSDVDGLPENIAASTAPGESGNNQNALAIQALQDETLNIRKWIYQRGTLPSSQDQSGTMDEYYTIFVGDMGMLVEENNQNQSFNQTMIDQLNEIRDSISGVNLDEETVNLIKYQHAFTAASKLVTVCDEMLENLLNMR